MNMKRATAVILGALLLPGVAMAQINTRATFEVTKTFADGNNVEEIVVSIDCNTGQILDQDKTLGDGDSVEFVVTAFTEGSLNCSIVEGDITDGYSASYDGDGVEGGCTWTAIDDGEAFNCDITNTPDPVDITVNKDWVIENDLGGDVNLNYNLVLLCLAGQNHDGSIDDRFQGGEGPADDQFTFSIVPRFPTSTCRVREDIYDSAIEVKNDCDNLVVSANKGASCTITNTVFFEGIPTLGQYGMAIMVLLMLGVGFVGFRRFV